MYENIRMYEKLFSYIVFVIRIANTNYNAIFQIFFSLKMKYFAKN